MSFEDEDYPGTPSWAYLPPGYYLLTLRVYNEEFVFGEIPKDTMILNKNGSIVEKYWKQLSERFPGVQVDTYIIMPNHLHGIVNIGTARAQDYTYYDEDDSRPKNSFISEMMTWFKIVTTREINPSRFTDEPLWKSEIWEHPITDAIALKHIRAHIKRNPLRWYWDKENPTRYRETPMDRWAAEAREDFYDEREPYYWERDDYDNREGPPY